MIDIIDAGVALVPDPARIIHRFFVPGQEDVGPGDSRAIPVVDRVNALSDREVDVALAEAESHSDLSAEQCAALFDANATAIGTGVDLAVTSTARRRLLGAVFTQARAIEGAALCNPSIVRAPVQPDPDACAFVLSVRGIGEGHRSSIGFRTGSVSADGRVEIDPVASIGTIGQMGPGYHHRSVLHSLLAELGDDHENAAYVLDALPATFTTAQLEERLLALRADAGTRRNTGATLGNLDALAHRSYRVDYDDGDDVSERVLWPRSPAERNGMEDARFVEITDGEGPRYCATYTAFDGTTIAQHLLTTDDFRSFAVTPLAGVAAHGKGLALFPRRVGGRYMALSRADRETNSVASSDDLRCWDSSTVIQRPRRAWEILQLGNCGSPIETPAGWLVLTHGVGALRTYSIGALLLDLDDPTRVIGSLREPLIHPDQQRRHGYVPNVAYSCGAMVVGERLVVPYGIGDQRIAFALMSVGDLLDALLRDGRDDG